MTDATGAKTTTSFITPDGQPAIVTDPLGNVTYITYNALGEPVMTTYPGGTLRRTVRCPGQPGERDRSAGGTSQYTMNPQIRTKLHRSRTANGATTSFAYTSQGDLAVDHAARRHDQPVLLQRQGRSSKASMPKDWPPTTRTTARAG